MKSVGQTPNAATLILACAAFLSMESSATDQAHFYVTPDALIILAEPNQQGVPQKVRIRGQGKLVELSQPVGQQFNRLEGIEFRGIANYNFQARWDAKRRGYQLLWVQQSDAIEWGRTASEICADPNFFHQLIEDARRIQLVAQEEVAPQSQLTQEAWRRLLDESCEPPRISQAQRQRLERVLTEILSSYSQNSPPNRLLQCYRQRGSAEVAEDTAGILASTFNPAPGTRTRAKISCDLVSDQLSGRVKHGQTEHMQLNLARISNDSQMLRTLLHEFNHMARPFRAPITSVPQESLPQENRDLHPRVEEVLRERAQRMQSDYHRVVELGEQCCAQGQNCERFQALDQAYRNEEQAIRELSESTRLAQVDLALLSRQLGENGHEANRITIEIHRRIQERLAQIRNDGCFNNSSASHSECLNRALTSLQLDRFGESPQTQALVKNLALRLICKNRSEDTARTQQRDGTDFARILVHEAEASNGTTPTCASQYMDNQTLDNIQRTHPGLFREASRELRERQIMRGGTRDPNRDENRMLLGRSATPAPTPAPGTTVGAVVTAATSLPDLAPSQWWRDSTPSSLNRQRASNRYRREIDDARTDTRIANPLGDYRPSDVRVGLGPNSQPQENVRIGRMQSLVVGQAAQVAPATPESVAMTANPRRKPDDPNATPAPGGTTPPDAQILAEGSLPIPRGRNLATAALARGVGGLTRSAPQSERDQSEEPPPAIDDAWPRARLMDTLVSEYRFVEPLLRDRSFLRRLNEERIGVEDRNGQRHGHRQPATWYTYDQNLERLKRSAGPRATPRP